MKKDKKAEKKFNDAILVFQKQMLAEGIEVNIPDVKNYLDNFIDEYLNKPEPSLNDLMEDINNFVNSITMKPENLEKHIKDWTEENAPFGKKLGYPDCCIKEFCNQPPVLLKYSKPSKDDKRRYKAGCIDGQFTGFIPCAFHAKEITMGKITLQSLIKDRSEDFRPFPNF